MSVYIHTFAGNTWQLPRLAGHVEGKKEFNRSLHQTRGSGRAFLSGTGLPKPMTMDVEIPCSVPVPAGQVTWDDGTNSRDMVLARRAFWEELLNKTDRWYVKTRFRRVLGLLLVDNSEFSVLRAQLAVRDPGWYLTPEDAQPVNTPGILVPGDVPGGGVVITPASAAVWRVFTDA